MANVRLRSPYYVTDTETGAAYATLNITVNNVLRYVITEDTNSSGTIVFEISRISKDYLDVLFNGSYISYTCNIDLAMIFYNSNGIQVGVQRNINHKGFAGYGDFEDGANPVVDPSVIMQSNTTAYVPMNTPGFIAYENSGTIGYEAFGATSPSLNVEGTVVTIRRICDPKYSPIKITFVNKFGALQDIYFDKKSTRSMSTEKDMYKSNIRTFTGTYQTTNHVHKTLRANGKESVTANTGFVCESMNEPFKQLMLSEQVWATTGDTIRPINITSSNLSFKTSVNDKLINYTIEFEYAFDSINNIY